MTIQLNMRRYRVRVVRSLVGGLVFAVLASFAGAQSRVSAKWEEFSTGKGDDMPAAIAADAQGNSYVTGQICEPLSAGPCGNEEAVTIKYDPNGTVLWRAFLTSPDADYRFATGSAVAVDNSGNVYVFGIITISGFFATNPPYPRQEFFTAKYAPNGTRLWIDYYDDENHSIKFAGGMVVDAQGNVFVTGNAGKANQTSVPQDGRFTTIKYSTSGKLLWAAISNLTNFDLPQAPAGIVLDGEGNAVITGFGFGRDSAGAPTFAGSSLLTIKYSAAGTQLWMKSHTGPGSEGTIGAAGIAIDRDGNIYAAGSDNLAVGFAELVIKYDAAGTELWTKDHAAKGFSNGSQASGITLDSEDNVLVTGTAQNIISSSQVTTAFDTIKFDRNGNFLWEALYDPSGSNDLDAGYGVLTNAEGFAYVTGRTGNSNGTFKWTTVKYDPTGQQIWAASFPGTFGAPFMAEAGGNLFVTGPRPAAVNPALEWETVEWVQDAAVPSPSGLTFAAQKEGTTSAAQSVTLRNSSTVEDLITDAIDVKGPFAETNNCPKSIVPGGSCTIKITFRPTTTGTQTGSVLFYDQWAGSPAVITLTGTGTN